VAIDNSLHLPTAARLPLFADANPHWPTDPSPVVLIQWLPVACTVGVVHEREASLLELQSQCESISVDCPVPRAESTELGSWSTLNCESQFEPLYFTRYSNLGVVPTAPSLESVPLEIPRPKFKSIEFELEPPKCRGRVFVQFEPRKISEAATTARQEATRQRPPDDDPLSNLFLLLLPEQGWDLRVHGLQHFLRAFPEGKAPFPYQQHGLRFLVDRENALLADEMGLGKTIQAILALRSLVHAGRVKHILIVCPRTLIPTWWQELGEWAPELSVGVAYGPERFEVIRRPHHIYITNYETVRRLQTGRNKRQFDLLVVDEIQNLKNASTLRATAVRELETKRRWGLSGTPIENRMSDYTSIWGLLDPKIGSRHHTDEWILEKTKPNVLRRTKKEVLSDLPSQLQRVVPIELDPQQRAAYDAQERSIQTEVEGMIESGTKLSQVHVFQHITRLKQICIFDPVSQQSAKLDWIDEQLHEMHPVWPPDETCEKALIFTQYPNLVWDTWQLPTRLKRFHPLRLDGSVKDADRIRFKKLFQTDERRRLAFIGLKVGGTGLTLTRANHVIFLDEWWNPAIMEQAAARVHRIGQTRTCYTTSLVATGTIEERIQDILKAKKELAENVMAEIRAGRRKPSDLPDLKEVLSMEDMLRALGLGSSTIQKSRKVGVSR